DFQPVLDQLAADRIGSALVRPFVDPRRRVDLPDDDVVRAAHAPRSADGELRSVLRILRCPGGVRSHDRAAKHLRVDVRLPRVELDVVHGSPSMVVFRLCGRTRETRALYDMIVTMAYDTVSTKRALEPWAMQSVAFARALPPKEKK